MSLTNAYVVKGPMGSHRNENEYYPTPAIGTLCLLRNHDVPNKLWEPAAGRGHIAKELIRNGHEVIATDLFSYDDPMVPITSGIDMTTAPRMDVDGVITNPPFKNNLPEKLITRSLEYHEYSFLAMFCRLTFMESARRNSLFKKHPPSNIYVFSERINCNERYFDKKHGIGGMVAYAWFVWDSRNKGKTVLDWIKPSDYIGEL